MTEFKKGVRAVIECEVVEHDPDPHHSPECLVEAASGTKFWVRSGDLKVAPYRDPELAPGQVVIPEDETDERSWWVRRGIGGGLCFLAPTANGDGAAYRPALPERIRVVWPR